MKNTIFQRDLTWALWCLGLLLVTAAQAVADLPPSVPPPAAVHLPAPTLRVLPNGLTVEVIERHSLPIIALRLVVRSGSEADPPDLPGTAQLVASLLNQGTSKRTAQEIAATIDRVGGTIDTGAEWDNSYVALRVLTDHVNLAFDLVSDMIVHTTFAPAEVERQRKQALSALEVAHNDPAYVADAVFQRLVFAGTPYDHPEDGTEEAVRRLTREQIREFYARQYRPSNSILAVVGDVRSAEAFYLAAKYFTGWRESASSAATVAVPPGSGQLAEAAPGGANASAPGSTTPTAGRRSIVLIDKPDAVQTEIRIGNRATPRNSPDFLALTVANQILGGPASNRLYRALRTEHGLTYSASSDLLCYQTAGSWEAKTFTRTPETVKSVRVALDEMKRLRDQPISEQELQTAQSYLTGHLALDVESSDGVATQMLELMIYHLPLDYWNRFPQDLNHLETGEVLNATRRHLDPEDSVVVLVGNVGSFGRELKKLGEVRVIPLHNLDLGSPDLGRPGGGGAGQ